MGALRKGGRRSKRKTCLPPFLIRKRIPFIEFIGGAVKRLKL